MSDNNVAPPSAAMSCMTQAQRSRLPHETPLCAYSSLNHQTPPCNLQRAGSKGLRFKLAAACLPALWFMYRLPGICHRIACFQNEQPCKRATATQWLTCWGFAGPSTAMGFWGLLDQVKRFASRALWHSVGRFLTHFIMQPENACKCMHVLGTLQQRCLGTHFNVAACWRIPC